MRKTLYVSIITAVLITMTAFISGCSKEVENEGKTWEKVTIPWKDYEEARYSITNEGKPTADVIHTIEKVSSNGQTTYKINSNYMQKKGEYRTGAIVSYKNLKPISSFIYDNPGKADSKLVELSGVYGEKLNITGKFGKETKSKSIKLPPVFYDNETLLHIPRVFPIKEDYSRRIRTCVLNSAAIEPFRIVVVGKEKVTVPAGTFKCFKVKLQYIGLTGYPNIYAWYTADSSKILVKYQQSKAMFKLKTVKYQK